MKSVIKVTALFLATIAVMSALGWVLAINSLKEWCDQFVAISMLEVEVKPLAIAVIRSKGKAIAPKAISITIKSDRPNYAVMTIRELKALCKGTGIKGWEKLRKAELVDALCMI